MNYSPHLYLRPVTDSDRIRRICEHYGLDVRDVAEMRCALGNQPTDPVPPWEVIVADISTYGEHEQLLRSWQEANVGRFGAGYPKPELLYHWVVSDGRKRSDIGIISGIEWGNKTADQVQEEILEKYVITSVFGKGILQDPKFGHPDAAVAAVCRRMRQNGVGNLIMVGSDFSDASEIRMFAWNDEEISAALRIASLRAVRRLAALIDADGNWAKDGSTAITTVGIGSSGLVAVYFPGKPRIIVVDQDDQRIPFETLLKAPAIPVTSE